MARILLALLVVPAVGLLTRPSSGCKKVSLLHRGDPADSKTIEGDDCGNVQQITTKWAKAKKVGGLAGKAKAAALAADKEAKNTEDAVKAAKALGEKVGLDGKIPESVKLAAEVAEKAGKAASEAAAKLGTTTDTFKGKFDDFAKAVSDDDMIKIKKETEETTVAAQDAIDAAGRVLEKAAKAKEDAMKNSAGAVKLIESTTAETDKLAKQAQEISQKSEHAVKDVDTMVKKSKAAAKKVDDKMKDAKEQKPVWEAYKADLEGREKEAEDAGKAVTDQIKKLGDATKDMGDKAKTLKDVKDKAQSTPALALGQQKNIDAAEESIRKTESELDFLKGKVGSMYKATKRLEAKIKETTDRLGH